MATTAAVSALKTVLPSPTMVNPLEDWAFFIFYWQKRSFNIMI